MVPVIVRAWPCSLPMPYRKTYRLQPGESWRGAPTTDHQFEYYVQRDGEAIPVGAAIAREVIDDGAAWACFTEMWAGRIVLVGPDLVCLPHDGPAGDLVTQLRTAHGGLSGLPDVVGQHHDGRVIMREAKALKSNDRLSASQHAFARTAQDLFGDRLDVAVVSWAVP